MEKMPEYKVGMSAVLQKRIEESDTARGMGRDSLETLLATPTYVDLMIRAAIPVSKRIYYGGNRDDFQSPGAKRLGNDGQRQGYSG